MRLIDEMDDDEVKTRKKSIHDYRKLICSHSMKRFSHPKNHCKLFQMFGPNTKCVKIFQVSTLEQDNSASS